MLISCFLPTRRIRIQPKVRFEFRRLFRHSRAQARDPFFRPSIFLWCINELCTNLF